MFIPKNYYRLKRGPQVILPKDIGLILTYSGVNKQSECLDAGTGGGWLAITLARISKKVTSYDIRDEFIKIAQKNKESEGLDNLILKKGDVTKGFKEKDLDLICLDMPNSEKVVKHAKKALKEGGCLVGYLIHMEQAKSYIAALNKNKFVDIVMLESIVRDYLVREEGMRPTTKGVWHTGYLIFANKPEKAKEKSNIHSSN